MYFWLTGGLSSVLDNAPTYLVFFNLAQTGDIPAGTEMLSLMLWGGVLSRFVSGVMADRLGGVMTLMVGSTLQCKPASLLWPCTTPCTLLAGWQTCAPT